jgi:hypothetical protein
MNEGMMGEGVNEGMRGEREGGVDWVIGNV